MPVVLEVRGMSLAPAVERRLGTAHVDLFLDVDLTPADSTVPRPAPGVVHLDLGQSWHTYARVAPGTHRLIALLVDWTHRPLAPLVADSVRFTVRPGR